MRPWRKIWLAYLIAHRTFEPAWILWRIERGAEGLVMIIDWGCGHELFMVMVSEEDDYYRALLHSTRVRDLETSSFGSTVVSCGKLMSDKRQ